MMDIRTLLSLFILVAGTACTSERTDKPLLLWYDGPAGNWNEALPVGNGRIGAMVFGGVEKERLPLNENTLYSGEPSTQFKNIKITAGTRDSVVALMKAGKYDIANDLVVRRWFGRSYQFYQPLGELSIENRKSGEVTGYRRELDISSAIARTAFKQNGVVCEREVFASYPDSVMVISCRSGLKDGLDLFLSFASPHPTARQSGTSDCLVLRGQVPGYMESRGFDQIEACGEQYKYPELYDGKGNRKTDKSILYSGEIDNRGMFFEARLKPVLPEGGGCEITDQGIHVYGTGKVYFLLGMATSFNGFEKSPTREGADASAKSAALLVKASAYDYEKLKERHINDYQSLFKRVKLNLPSSPEQEALPTDRRIERFDSVADPQLAALLFQFGRYLMISGSRPGGQPLNLQGMWNKDVMPAWHSGYTMNINTEMNYWPAEPTNLSECHEPLFRLIRELSVSGSEAARSMFGNRGWVSHHTTSIWREVMPHDMWPSGSFWPMAQGWLCSHLWEHYQFTQDTGFLRDRAYPLMKGAAEFFSDWLVRDDEGYLTTPVGVSPENSFVMENGKHVPMSMGPTMDISIIRETFSRTLAAAELLDKDRAFRDELREKLSLLPPFRIGSRGQLQEWSCDFKEAEPKHRHISHLYGLYPGDQITEEKTPELLRAVRKSLELRGDEATGWSMGWKINCWARLQDGNHAYKIISKLFNPVGFGRGRNGGGLYKSMLDAHPPFQIDGNFGYTAGVAEMLLQSHAGFIQMLPALPDVWSEGSVSGLKARGNFEVAIKWQDGKLTGGEILSGAGKVCRLRTSLPVTVERKGKTVAVSSPVTSSGKSWQEVSFDTNAGDSYLIKARPFE